MAKPEEITAVQFTEDDVREFQTSELVGVIASVVLARAAGQTEFPPMVDENALLCANELNVRVPSR